MEPVDFLLYQSLSSGAFIVILYVLNGLSRRIGEAMQMKPYYHLYTLGSIVILVALIIQGYIIFTFSSLTELQWSRFIVLVNLLLALGVTFSFIAMMKYWSWILKEIL